LNYHLKFIDRLGIYGIIGLFSDAGRKYGGNVGRKNTAMTRVLVSSAVFIVNSFPYLIDDRKKKIDGR
jgi:hypothetical protein